MSIKIKPNNFLIVSHIFLLLFTVYLYHAEWLRPIMNQSVFLYLATVPMIVITLFALEIGIYEYLIKLEKENQ